jgi:hypothetical protein
MTIFEPNFFQPFAYTPDDLEQYMQNALRDLTIAREDDFSEVTFTYAYQALIKAGIVLIAHTGQVKVRSVPGHHVKILEKMGEVLDDTNIMALGNAVRMKRNTERLAVEEMPKRRGDSAI